MFRSADWQASSSLRRSWWCCRQKRACFIVALLLVQSALYLYGFVFSNTVKVKNVWVGIAIRSGISLTDRYAFLASYCWSVLVIGFLMFEMLLYVVLFEISSFVNTSLSPGVFSFIHIYFWYPVCADPGIYMCVFFLKPELNDLLYVSALSSFEWLQRRWEPRTITPLDLIRSVIPPPGTTRTSWQRWPSNKMMYVISWEIAFCSLLCPTFSFRFALH